jgi:hypothetical protein
MKQELTSAPAPPAVATAAQDLSAEIILSIDRSPGDRVTCKLVYGDHYRCNWWTQQSTSSYDNPAMHGLLVTTHRVRKSQFLKATKSKGELKIESSPAR